MANEPKSKANSKALVKGKKLRPGDKKRVFELDRDHSVQAAFGSFASEIARITGKPMAFFGAVAFVLIWAASGPFFEFSTTWQLIINTATTIVTVLMVFLIQNTQYRDTMALQLKLAELILVIEGTESKMALAEDLSHEDLEMLKEDLQEKLGSPTKAKK
jgi:low affinity Fe/Cu permease